MSAAEMLSGDRVASHGDSADVNEWLKMLLGVCGELGGSYCATACAAVRGGVAHALSAGGTPGVCGALGMRGSASGERRPGAVRAAPGEAEASRSRRHSSESLRG